MKPFQCDIPLRTVEVNTQDEQLLYKVKNSILKNLSTPHYGTNELAGTLGKSPVQTARALKRLSPMAPARLIRHFKMAYAQYLVNESTKSVKEIAFECGFPESANFCRAYKNHFGENPSNTRLRKQHGRMLFEFRCSTPLQESELKYVLRLGRDHDWLNRALQLMMGHIQDEHFGAEQLASTLAMSTSTLNRRLNALIKITAGRLIKNIRLRYATELLLHSSLTSSEIAFRAGYFDHPHFSRDFKSAYGQSPHEYRVNRNQKGHLITEILIQYKTDN